MDAFHSCMHEMLLNGRLLCIKPKEHQWFAYKLVYLSKLIFQKSCQIHICSTESDIWLIRFAGVEKNLHLEAHTWNLEDTLHPLRHLFFFLKFHRLPGRNILIHSAVTSLSRELSHLILIPVSVKFFVFRGGKIIIIIIIKSQKSKNYTTKHLCVSQTKPAPS